MNPHPQPGDESAPAARSSSGGQLSLDQWIALNDEIAALVRAGLPLERGLMGLGSDSLGRLGSISRDLAARLEKGETLQQALHAERSRLPALYGAVVEAGVRSGRLPAALESLAAYARNYADMRKALGISLIYPLIVGLIAYALFIGFILLVVPRFLGVLQEFRLAGLGFLSLLHRMGHYAVYWGPIIPLLVVVFLAFWMGTGKAQAFGTAPARTLLRWLPWTRRLLDDSAAASFAELLALLVEQGVPFPQAIELAGEASGDPSLEAEARTLAAAVRQGDAGAQAVVLTSRRGGLPALLGWLLGAGYRQGAIVPALQHAAATYRRRTYERLAIIRKLLPTLALVLIGGFSVLFYTLCLFVPFSSLLDSLAEAF